MSGSPHKLAAIHDASHGTYLDADCPECDELLKTSSHEQRIDLLKPIPREPPKPEIPEGWITIPKIGTEVSADHPQTVVNPTKTFFVHEIKVDGNGKIWIRGESTIFFSLNMIKPVSKD